MLIVVVAVQQAACQPPGVYAYRDVPEAEGQAHDPAQKRTAMLEPMVC